MIKTMVFLYLLTPIFLYGSSFCLKDKFLEAEPGDYVVFEQNKHGTLLHVYEVENSSIVLEEISIPLLRYTPLSLSWREWFDAGAPGHTSWVCFKIHLDTGAMERYDAANYLCETDASSSHTFLSLLLNLKFQSIPEESRRHIGKSPGYHQPDHRPLWNPPLVVNGTRLPHYPFSAWKSYWPADGSQLANKGIEVYFPEVQETDKTFPAYFPYWVEIEGHLSATKIRIIDSGNHLLP